VDQRVGVDQFQRTGNRHQSRRGLPLRFCRGNGQDRADSFPSRHKTVSHAFVEGGRRRGRTRHDGIEEPIHVVSLLFEVVLDVHGAKTGFVITSPGIGAERNKRSGGCQTEGEGMTPALVPCSRNAHDQNVLVRRPQWDQRSCHSQKEETSRLGGITLNSARSMRAVKGSLGHPYPTALRLTSPLASRLAPSLYSDA